MEDALKVLKDLMNDTSVEAGLRIRAAELVLQYTYVRPKLGE